MQGRRKENALSKDANRVPEEIHAVGSEAVLVVRAHLALGMALVAGSAQAQSCERWVAKVVSVQGPVELQCGGGAGSRAAGFDATLCAGDRIRVGPLGGAVQLADEAETLIRWMQGSKVRPSGLFYAGVSRASCTRGVGCRTCCPTKQPFVAARVEGPELVLRVGKKKPRSSSSKAGALRERRRWSGRDQSGSGRGPRAPTGTASRSAAARSMSTMPAPTLPVYLPVQHHGGSGPSWRTIPLGKRCPPAGSRSDVCA